MKNPKIGAGLKRFYAANVHPGKGKPGRSQSEDERARKRAKLLAFWDARGRIELTDKQKKAANKANVYAYRARLRNAIPPDADLKLIRKIYEACPDGYQVDHVVALVNGGQHHQNNLQYLTALENKKKGRGNKYDHSLAIPWKQIIEV